MNNQPTSPASRRIIPDTRFRDTLIAVCVGAAILGVIAYATLSFSRQANSTGWVDGTIVSKHFEPQPETQITFGKNGLNSRRIEGEYSVQVRVQSENGQEYKVLVDSGTYASREVGDQLRFQRSAPGAP